MLQAQGTEGPVKVEFDNFEHGFPEGFGPGGWGHLAYAIGIAFAVFQLMVAAWNETMAFDSRQRLAEIASPTLVVAGSDDQAVPMHHAQMLHEGIRGSKLAVIAGARHTLIWTHPDELVRATDEFLAAAA